MELLLCCLSLNKRKKSITVNLNIKKEKLEFKTELLKDTGKLSYNKHTLKKKTNRKTQVLYSNTSSKKINIKTEPHQNVLFLLERVQRY